MQSKPKIEATVNVPQAGHPDPEGRMAKSELYRAAKMSMKLFQMIQDGQQLEAWVQAKITKSADYLDSIYHYMEYQAKFGGGAPATSVDDITTDLPAPVEEPEEAVEIDESWTYEEKLQALLEARMKKEGFEAGTKVGATKKTATGTLTKTATGVRHTRDKFEYDPGSDDKDDKKQKRNAKKKVSEAKKEKEPEGLYSKKRFETDAQRVARLAKEKRQAEKKKEAEKTNEATDTVEKDAEGNVKSWKHEGDWKKTGAKKDPRGKVTHMSDVARRKTEKMGKK